MIILNNILRVIMILLLVSCGSDKENPWEKEKEITIKPFELRVTDADFSMAYELQYFVNDKKLKIIFSGELEGETDSILWETNLKPNNSLKELSEIKLDSLKEHYINNCIEDGSQISIYYKNDKVKKESHLSNYYIAEIGFIINHINHLSPERFKIWYDKDYLLKIQSNCKE